MMALRTCNSASARLRNSLLLLLGLLWLSPTAHAQDTLRVELGDSVQVTLPKKEKEQRKGVFRGVAVGADIVGPIMKAFGSEWALMEVVARVNLKEKFFPIAEVGLGVADHEGRDIDNRFNVHAPYFRVGMDYNINKNTRGNRLFAGVRYGISAFNYDLTSPTPLTDPVWKTSQPFNYESMRATAQWAEVLFGLETRIWKMVRVGWDVRFKFRITQTTGEVGPPWFIPGFGKNDTSGWGGTFKVMVEL